MMEPINESMRNIFAINVEKTVEAILNSKMQFIAIKNVEVLRAKAKKDPSILFELTKAVRAEVVYKDIDMIDIEQTIKSIDCMHEINKDKVREAAKENIMFLVILANDLHAPILYKD